MSVKKLILSQRRKEKGANERKRDFKIYIVDIAIWIHCEMGLWMLENVVEIILAHQLRQREFRVENRTVNYLAEDALEFFAYLAALRESIINLNDPLILLKSRKFVLFCSLLTIID